MEITSIPRSQQPVLDNSPEPLKDDANNAENQQVKSNSPAQQTLRVTFLEEPDVNSGENKSQQNTKEVVPNEEVVLINQSIYEHVGTVKDELRKGQDNEDIVTHSGGPEPYSKNSLTESLQASNVSEDTVDHDHQISDEKVDDKEDEEMVLVKNDWESDSTISESEYDE